MFCKTSTGFFNFSNKNLMVNSLQAFATPSPESAEAAAAAAAAAAAGSAGEASGSGVFAEY